ncbi:hypothetical protein LTR35_008428 [Friedmanniomyces endolithicus]|nr:hypothetical protein LTR35_008428 [Friedmanniomyces endolithicus]KAK0294821.1 hypothetical protein LTS00_006656 [Friedmanniomyces endolithicus]KAK1002185.1 hypothetical protein LTR54_008197 [Friedmanniomyces endolithicus]
MATNYSRSRTKWRILQILFVLFATVAQCREFVDWNSTSPAVKVGTPPSSPTDSPEDLEIYQGDEPPSTGCTPGVQLEPDVAEVYRQLQISDTTDENLMFRWTQHRQRGPGSTQASYGQAGTPDYFARNTPYGTTGAYYENQINPVGGMLLSMYNFGPEYMMHNKGKSGPPPPMKRLSDVLWFQWEDACRVFGVHVNNIRYFYQHQASDEDTQVIMYVVNGMPEQEARPWPGVDYYPDDPGVNGNIGKAFLGSPNGNAVAFFLAQHEALIGKRLTVEKVRYWGDAWAQYDLHLLFYIVEVPEADKSLTPTLS